MGLLNIFSKKTQKKPGKDLPELAHGILVETKKEKESSEKPLESLPKLTKKPIQTEQVIIHAPQIENKTLYIEQSKKEPSFEQLKEFSTQDLSFFSDLLSHLRKEEALIDEKHLSPDELRSRNLVEEMKAYWNDQKTVFQQLKETQKLEQELVSNIEELQRYEQEWQQLENQLEENKRSLKEKEIQIEKETLRLKDVLRKWNLKKDASEKHYFHLKNGVYCKNVMELLNALRKMDDTTFHHHVTPEKNDFAIWVHDVFNDKTLASELESIVSKEKMIEILSRILE